MPDTNCPTCGGSLTQDEDSCACQPIAVTYRLHIGKWHRGYQTPEIWWEDIHQLPMTDRDVLVRLAAEVLRLPGIAAVRIAGYDERGSEIKECVDG